MMSINAVKGFEYGAGFQAASMTGLEHNDAFVVENARVRTETNYSGGIQGGISNGEDIFFNVAFKPVASVSAKQKTINTQRQEEIIEVKGRHDVCVVPRAIPVVEAMAALVIADFLMFPNNNSAS
jgi:chorismate synthase